MVTMNVIIMTILLSVVGMVTILVVSKSGLILILVVMVTIMVKMSVQL